MLKINLGSGPTAVADGWLNYDASPTARLQKLPVLGAFFKSALKPAFSDSVLYGDILRGLPHAAGSIDIVYSSHVLEHLSLNDFRNAIKEVWRVLRPGGIFRSVLPDPEFEVRTYLDSPSSDACSEFMAKTGLGQLQRPRTAIEHLRGTLGNTAHRWMWDYKGISEELRHAHFSGVRRAYMGDSIRSEMAEVEDASRWANCLGFECNK